MEICAYPGCSEPGTNRCAGCKTTPYCGTTCQTAHWPTHKEFCDGRLRKMGMDHLNKAEKFHKEKNWLQTLHHSDLAVTKLKQLKDRPLEAISDALSCKCAALDFLGRHREQLECSKEWYCLWNTKPTDVGAIDAAFVLIQSCIQYKEYEDARLYASTLYEIINHKYDNKIPEDKRQEYIAKGAYFLASATLRLAQDGGIPPGEKQKAGQEAIALLRKALEMHTQVYVTEHQEVACAMDVLADALDFFNDVDDDEVLRLHQQAKAIHIRVYGNSSVSVAVCENNQGTPLIHKANRARSANDLDLVQTNLEIALLHLYESSRIYRAIGHADGANFATRRVVRAEEGLRLITIAKASNEATTKG